jgi:cell division protein FtsQ
MGKKSYRNTNTVRKRFLIRGLKVLLFLVIPLFIFGYAFKLEEITVTGATRYTQEEIKEQLTASKLDSNALLMYLKYNYFTNFKLPYVEKADIKLAGSHSISVRIYEKIMTGCVEFMGEYLYFDKDGIIVESSSELLPDIPLIKGLKFKKIILNEKLEVQKDELFDTILNLTQLVDKYGLDVKTIRFNSDYEVTVESGDIIALLGKRTAYDEVLSELKNILQGSEGELNHILDESEGTKLELDMRKYNEDTKTLYATPRKSSD